MRPGSPSRVSTLAGGEYGSRAPAAPLALVDRIAGVALVEAATWDDDVVEAAPSVALEDPSVAAYLVGEVSPGDTDDASSPRKERRTEE